MSNAIEIRHFGDAIAAACVSAWDVTRCFITKPRTLVLHPNLPYAVIAPDPVDISFSAVGAKQSVDHAYSFSIMGRFALPDPDLTAPYEAADRANELIAILQANEVFASYGYMPLVTSVSFDESDNPDEAVYEVMLSFSVRAVADHH